MPGRADPRRGRARSRRALPATAVAVAALLLAACTSGSTGRPERPPTTSVAAAGTATSVAPAGAATTDAGAGRNPGGSMPATTAATGPVGPAGAAGDGVGDRLFPEAGNVAIDVQRVDAAFDWQPVGSRRAGRLDAEVTLTVALTDDRRGLQLDLRSLVVTAATIDGRTATVQQRDGELLLDADRTFHRGAVHEVVVRYGGEPEPVDDGTGMGIRVGWITTAGGSYTANEPIGASTWLVGNDHPSDKATYRLAVTVPDGLEVIATGTARDRRPGPRPATTTWSFEARDPVATYLVSVATGHFDRRDGRAPETGVPLRNAFPEGSGDRLAAVFAGTGAMVDTLSRLFGPYPFEVYGALVVDEPLGYALENQTLSLFDTDLGPGSEVMIVHELAHQWFGDSVSVAEWSDIWLNEGFATYAEALWNEASRPGYDIDAAMARVRANGAGLGPIGDPDRSELFGTAVYQRGGLTLHALRRTIGDDAFFTVLRRWAAEHRNQSVTTAQFVALASEVAGRPLQGFFDEWLFARTMPPLPR